MRRYVEIIFDKSASMDYNIGNFKKNEIAKRIFNDSVLPYFNFLTDNISFRLLRNG
jgi:hypothetical protein